jgi:hypothetical protein
MPVHEVQVCGWGTFEPVAAPVHWFTMSKQSGCGCTRTCGCMAPHSPTRAVTVKCRRLVVGARRDLTPQYLMMCLDFCVKPASRYLKSRERERARMD